MTADGAYDGEAAYDAVAERHPRAAVIISPRATAVPEQINDDDAARSDILQGFWLRWTHELAASFRPTIAGAWSKPQCIATRPLSAGGFNARTPSNQKTEAKIWLQRAQPDDATQTCRPPSGSADTRGKTGDTISDLFMHQSALDANDDRASLDLLVRGFQISRMLRPVADIGVADRIEANDQLAIDTLAEACGVLPQPLIRVLRALAAFGVVLGRGRWQHRAHTAFTDAAANSPNSMHHSARCWSAPGSWAAWGMLDVAMNGGVPQVAAWNTERFSYLRMHPDEARGFDAMMANHPDNRHAAVAAAYDFSGAALIADIGGGNGEALRHILARFPGPRGLLFDRDDVVSVLQAADLLDGRIMTAGGSFFDSVPPGADIYMLVHVLHNWSDEACLRILRACRTAMRPHAVLLIGEHLLEPEPARGRPTSYLMDIQMMAMFGTARERTEAEFVSLLSGAGFRPQQVIPTQSPTWIIEAGS